MLLAMIYDYIACFHHVLSGSILCFFIFILSSQISLRFTPQILDFRELIEIHKILNEKLYKIYDENVTIHKSIYSHKQEEEKSIKLSD